ncbi:unnamed protein product [Polarella glacialis]|uniref:Charged multivesicular body protein 6 n=1 Tax=Polarella glacialis TaxID=89957 RepID=A0A813GVT0_POLGL|nr:unnamed protein product [Polarella glacialis]
MGLGGSKKQNEAPRHASVDDEDRAMLDLKTQRDQLLAHRRRLDARAERDGEVARSLVQLGRKPQAVLALRKRRQHQQLAADCQGHLGRLEELIESVEMARVQHGAVEALAVGVDMLRRIQRDIGGIDHVHRLLGEQEEAFEAQQEIAAALAGVGQGSADDTEALGAELSRLEELFAASAASALEVTGPAASGVAVSSSAASSDLPAAAPEAPAAHDAAAHDAAAHDAAAASAAAPAVANREETPRVPVAA